MWYLWVVANDGPLYYINWCGPESQQLNAHVNRYFRLSEKR
jgi:hypothetical protein